MIRLSGGHCNYIVMVFYSRLKSFEVVEFRVVQAEAVSEGEKVFAWAVLFVVAALVEVGVGVAVENGDAQVVDRWIGSACTCC